MKTFDVGDKVLIKGFKIPGVIVGHHGKFNTVEYQTQVFGEPNKVHLNRFGCLDEELEKIDAD